MVHTSICNSNGRQQWNNHREGWMGFNYRFYEICLNTYGCINRVMISDIFVCNFKYAHSKSRTRPAVFPNKPVRKFVLKTIISLTTSLLQSEYRGRVTAQGVGDYVYYSAAGVSGNRTRAQINYVKTSELLNVNMATEQYWSSYY